MKRYEIIRKWQLKAFLIRILLVSIKISTIVDCTQIRLWAKKQPTIKPKITQNKNIAKVITLQLHKFIHAQIEPYIVCMQNARNTKNFKNFKNFLTTECQFYIIFNIWRFHIQDKVFLLLFHFFFGEDDDS